MKQQAGLECEAQKFGKETGWIGVQMLWLATRSGAGEVTTEVLSMQNLKKSFKMKMKIQLGKPDRSYSSMWETLIL